LGRSCDNGQLSSFNVDFVQNHTSTPVAVAAANHSKLGFSNDYGKVGMYYPFHNFLTLQSAMFMSTYLRYPQTLILTRRSTLDQIHKELYKQLMEESVGAQQVKLTANNSISSIAVSPNYAKDKTAFTANISGEVWRTQNGGDNWSRIGSDSIITPATLRPYMWIAISPQFATDRLVLVGTNNGVFRSTNGGDKWEPITNPRIGPSTVIQQIEFSPNFGNDNTVFVNVRGKGLYRLNMNNLGWVKSTSNVGLSLLNKNIQFTEFRISPNFAQDATLMGAS
jgi:hypothetical protein